MTPASEHQHSRNVQVWRWFNSQQTLRRPGAGPLQPHKNPAIKLEWVLSIAEDAFKVTPIHPLNEIFVEEDIEFICKVELNIRTLTMKEYLNCWNPHSINKAWTGRMSFVISKGIVLKPTKINAVERPIYRERGKMNIEFDLNIFFSNQKRIML